MDPTTRGLFATSAGATTPVYVEEVFQTWLYTGNGSTQTITNGIDLSGKGGMVWIKSRSENASDNNVSDTARGNNATIKTNTTAAQVVFSSSFGIQHGASGFTIQGNNNSNDGRNNTGQTYASWTFRKQAKFFDVVTVTTTSTTPTISHNLGAIPGAIIRKRVDSTSDWFVWHRELTPGNLLYLNLTLAEDPSPGISNVTSTNFKISASTGTYVFYIFAHDAGGFGASGNDSIIKCGSYDATSSGSVDLGWEPQWVLAKPSTPYTGGWDIWDNMRGFTVAGNNARLQANTSSDESAASTIRPTSTGFTHSGLGGTWIYIAIRRGPMKTPTDATKVFDVEFQGSGTTAVSPTFNSNFVTDFLMRLYQPGGASAFPLVVDRLRGSSPYLTTSSTAAETASTALAFDSMLGVYSTTLGQNSSIPGYLFRRAPGFFDVVAYTGTASARTVSHNLGVAPQLIIFKSRSPSGPWFVYPNIATKFLELSTNDSATTSSIWNNTAPTNTVFTLTGIGPNSSGTTYIAYLFASCPGISKVGSYTGTGTTLSIDCGFTAGARFVLIKRTDDIGDWYVWDTARGIVSGNDSYLLLNSTAAEVTNTDYIDPLNAGFQISSTAPAAINANGGSFIYLAIA